MLIKKKNLLLIAGLDVSGKTIPALLLRHAIAQAKALNQPAIAVIQAAQEKIRIENAQVGSNQEVLREANGSYKYTKAALFKITAEIEALLEEEVEATFVPVPNSPEYDGLGVHLYGTVIDGKHPSTMSAEEYVAFMAPKEKEEA